MKNRSLTLGLFLFVLVNSHSVNLCARDPQRTVGGFPIVLLEEPIGRVGENRSIHLGLSMDEAGVLSVVFLDRRNDPNNYLYDLYISQSSDGGSSWSRNLRISDVSSDPQAGSITAGLLGEYIGVTSSHGRVNSIWTDTRNGHQDAYTARIYTDPAVDARAIPESTDLQLGDTLRYTIRAVNTSGVPVAFQGAGFVTTPGGEPFGFGPGALPVK